MHSAGTMACSTPTSVRAVKSAGPDTAMSDTDKMLSCSGRHRQHACKAPACAARTYHGAYDSVRPREAHKSAPKLQDSLQRRAGDAARGVSARSRVLCMRCAALRPLSVAARLSPRTDSTSSNEVAVAAAARVTLARLQARRETRKSAQAPLNAPTSHQAHTAAAVDAPLRVPRRYHAGDGQLRAGLARQEDRACDARARISQPGVTRRAHARAGGAETYHSRGGRAAAPPREARTREWACCAQRQWHAAQCASRAASPPSAPATCAGAPCARPSARARRAGAHGAPPRDAGETAERKAVHAARAPGPPPAPRMPRSRAPGDNPGGCTTGRAAGSCGGGAAE
jgi:hypothetical protein